eukprot:1158928-Pelagomonas_calceolata.AAC.7
MQAVTGSAIGCAHLIQCNNADGAVASGDQEHRGICGPTKRNMLDCDDRGALLACSSPDLHFDEECVRGCAWSCVKQGNARLQ